MTMQPSLPPQARGQQLPYARRKTTATKGTYHKVHDGLLTLADKDGVFQTTDATNQLMDDLGVNRSSAASAIFQWSDPTGKRGYRRVRLYSPRISASVPPEMPEEKQKNVDIHWAQRAFKDLAPVNKNGPFYVSAHSGLFRGERKLQMLEQLLKFQKENGDRNGFWMLREGVNAMAGLGFNPTSVYNLVRHVVDEDDGGEKRGWRRRIKPEYVDALRGDEPEQVPVGAEVVNDSHTYDDEREKANSDPEPDALMFDPVIDFNNQGLRIQQEPPREDLREKVEALVEGVLSAPETIRAIDKLVGEAIIASAKRQLGV